MTSKFSEGINKIYKGHEIGHKHITLFSILGIISICVAYNSLAQSEYFEINKIEIYIIILLNLLWTFYATGYETKFINNVFNRNNDDIVPEFDKEPFKITSKQIPLILFVINSILIIVATVTHKENYIFFISIFIGAFLSLFQIGYSQKYSNSDALDIFRIFNFSDYLLLLLKRFWVNLLAYLTSFGIVFIIAIIAGIVIITTGFSQSNSFTEIIFAAQSSQIALTKLSIYTTTILLNYFIFVGNLAWDYDITLKFINKKTGV